MQEVISHMKDIILTVYIIHLWVFAKWLNLQKLEISNVGYPGTFGYKNYLSINITKKATKTFCIFHEDNMIHFRLRCSIMLCSLTVLVAALSYSS